MKNTNKEEYATEIIRDKAKCMIIVKNAKVPTRYLERLREKWGGKGFRFICRKPRATKSDEKSNKKLNNKPKEPKIYEVRMIYPPKVHLNRLLDAEIELMNCIVHQAPLLPD